MQRSTGPPRWRVTSVGERGANTRKPYPTLYPNRSSLYGVQYCTVCTPLHRSPVRRRSETRESSRNNASVAVSCEKKSQTHTLPAAYILITPLMYPAVSVRDC